MLTPKKADPVENESSRIGLLDLLRMFGGVLLFNALLSYWFTSTTTWNYQIPHKYYNPSYIKSRIIPTQLQLTMSELSLYNGSDTTLPVYVAVYGKVYDVSASRKIYGPRGSYHVFAGKDCARLFHNGCIHRADQLTYDLRGLPDLLKLMKDIEAWQLFFERHDKYWQVGEVIHEDLTHLEPPDVCIGAKYPG